LNQRLFLLLFHVLYDIEHLELIRRQEYIFIGEHSFENMMSGGKEMKKKWLIVGVILFVLVSHTLTASALVFPVTVPLLKSLASLSALNTAGIEERNDDVIWDNYPPLYGSGYSSQYDTAYPWQSQVADDFIFEEDMQVTGVHWWGMFWAGPPWPNPCDFYVLFYADDGTGTMPTGAGMEDPSSTALAFYDLPEVLGTLFSTDSYEYNVTLPHPFNASADTKYWIVIQAKVDCPPQWGWSTNGQSPDQLHAAVQGFPLMGVSYWTNLLDGEMAFVLYGTIFFGPSPPVIYGPTEGIINVEYLFWTGPITDPDEEPCYCCWDWGDGYITGWLGPYPSGSVISASHSWTQPGAYEIRAKLRDSDGDSVWSEPHAMTIHQGEPPSTPIITGPSQGKPGVTYTYMFNGTVSDGETIWYYIDWGDNTSSGWIGPFESGQLQTAHHSWAKKGAYLIRIKAKDHNDLESSWGTLPMNIPISTSISFPAFWMRVFERFSNAFPFLWYLFDFIEN